MTSIAATELDHEPSAPHAGRVLLVASNGGHLAQLLALRPCLQDYERCWVTFQKEDAESQLDGEHVVWAHYPTTRNLPNLFRNLLLAVRLLLGHRVDAIVSTGAGVAYPFFIVGRLLRIPSIYIEVYDRIDSPTLTGRLCRPLSDVFAVQWREQLQFYRHAKHVGPLL